MKSGWRAWLMVAAFLIVGGDSEANVGITTEQCPEIARELRQMHQAQTQLLQSFVYKNETVASSFDAFARRLSDQEKKAKKVSSVDVASLRNSAEAFRSHRDREKKLIDKFDKATFDLISKVQACLGTAAN